MILPKIPPNCFLFYNTTTGFTRGYKYVATMALRIRILRNSE